MRYEITQPNRGEMIKQLYNSLPPDILKRRLSAFKKRAIDPRRFTHHNPETIVRHSNEVTAIKADIAERGQEEMQPGLTHAEATELATYAEYLLIKGVDNGWIPFCAAIKTSEYDDFINGVDAVLEYSNNAIAHIGLGIDVSYSRANIQDKVAGIKSEIDAGTLALVEYFESEKSGNFGHLRHIPRVVVVMDLPVIADLHKTDSASFHPIKHAVLMQIFIQLSTMHSYAQEIKPKVAERIKRPLVLITALIQKLGTEQKYEESGYSKNKAMEAQLANALKDTFGEEHVPQ